MEEEILSIQTPVVFDESIAHQEIHAHKPYASSTFNNSDEIRITVQHQDLCILPSKSSLHISGKLVKSDGTAAAITTRSKSDSNAIVQSQEEDFSVLIDQVEWLVPYVKLSDQRKIAPLNFIEKDTPVSMSFHSWEL
ncbi:uncharacterized protein LOC124407466 [Diprion similis]|uniref:uncharacterized protein LOC124407466 n=1 Tax=Diprion similis TaxID=362088 RepID=UPI001EF7C246|nr:uncharacterized protein LOC124407466 [Diprion similis]